MKRYDALFETISVHLFYCMESMHSRALINACVCCPYRDFKDDEYTCVAFLLSERVIGLLPHIKVPCKNSKKEKRRKKHERK